MDKELYNAASEELVRKRNYAKDLCFEYNSIRPSLTEKRDELIRRILGKAGSNILIEQPFWCDYGYNIEVGDNFYANHGLVILDGAKVIFGNNVFIAPQCGFYTAGHPIDYQTRNSELEYALPITVGDNVWIGGMVSVLPGVTIGSGSVIGAGSVVVRDVPENSVAAGNPCKVIRKII
ncbi:MAG: sugar O-acetyltransferase [Oscillospiraceae bacterium]|nr:sugar O-acetyltransferase [Oscillospiraceae bacterium]